MRYLLSSSAYGELVPNPRSVIDLYELMMWAIPELAAVVDMHSRVIGFPDIETKDASFQRDWDDFVKEFAWVCELDHPFKTTVGLKSYVQTLSKEILSTGQGFCTLLDSQGNPITRTSQPIGSVRLHESRRFDFMQYEVDKFRLTYEHGGMIDMDVRESPSLTSIQFQTAITCVQECHTYGFWGGLWHGMIAPLDFIGMLIWPDDVTMYAQDNNGGWYAFGFCWGAGIFFGSSYESGRRVKNR